IRSHFSAIGHPLVCDALYAGKRLVCPAGLTRHFLHAKNIEFTNASGGRMQFEADLPDDLQRVLATIK
ncbi:MAG TPA: RluA family pseudouridine synthase, partial [Patescibacteria group bacterium]|nr:RluA family pseudouridine synthase [Patescibacteria group bacterium]